MVSRILVSIAVALTLTAVRADLSVEESEDGTLSVLRDGRVFIRSIVASSPGPGPECIEKSFETAADGSRVWNRWSPEKEGRFRLEVVSRADGAIELSLIGEADGATTNRMRSLWLNVPYAALNGRPYRMMVGSGDAAGARQYSFAPREGTFGKDTDEFSTRWIETDGVVWDFNPLGVAAKRAMGRIVPEKTDGFRFGREAGFTAQRGGHGVIKIVLREGRYEDYRKYHGMLKYYYSQRLPGVHVSLGAPQVGADYRPGDCELATTNGFGWMNAPIRRTVVGHPSGAYYSHVTGSGEAVYRIAGLIDGFHIVTFQAGNYTGTTNAFSVAVNGEVLADSIAVGKRKARTVSRAVRIVGGTADFRLSGDWIVSGFAVQPLLSDAEDFQVRRGFWYVPGYEPASIHRSSHNRPPEAFPVCDETIDMPVPGQETAGAYREPPRPIARANREEPSLQWLKNARLAWILENDATMAELDDPSWRKTYLDRLAKAGCNAAYVSGMLSRHTYPKEMSEYGQRMVATLAKELHARNMKCIDHFDVTLLWNVVAGARTMMERLPETLRARQDNLPSMHFCPNNPEQKRRVFAYVRQQVENGVDGFQLDEVEFWSHGCTCKFCRERFHDETGWWYPLDETDPSVAGKPTELQKRWFVWRYQTIANWFVELRQHLRDVNPNVVFSMYNVHWNFMATRFAEMYSTDLLELGRVIDLMGTEVLVQNKIQMARPLVTLQRLFNVLNKLYDVPIFGIYYNWDMKRKYFCWAIGNMLGQSAHPGECWPDPMIPDFLTWAAGPMNMKRAGATPIAEIGLLFSRHSRDWNDTGYYNMADLLGLAQELEAMSMPYEFIGDANLNPRDLSKYKILFLGVSQCLTDAEIAEIKAYAARGGKVCLCEGTGSKTEFGVLRPAGVFEEELVDPLSNISIMPLAKDFHAWQRNNPQNWGFSPDKAAQWAFRRTIARMIRSAGATYWKPHGVPAQVYTAFWREADGSVVIHFLNGTGAAESFAGEVPRKNPDPAFPPLQQDISFLVPADAPALAVAVSPDFAGETSLPTKPVGDGMISVTLPKELVRVYTLVRIKKAKQTEE